MNVDRHTVAAVLALLALAACVCRAQGIPNPLQPHPSPAAIVPAKTLPTVTPVASEGPHSGPLPPGGTGATGTLAPLPSGTPLGRDPVNDLREELARYTVTAVVGDAAVLRTNVGSVAGKDGDLAKAAGAGDPFGARSSRQQMMQVKSGSAVTVGGATVMPTVVGSTVQFRLRGDAVLATVYLDSQSAPYAVPAGAREQADPQVMGRASPQRSPGASIGATAPGAGGLPR